MERVAVPLGLISDAEDRSLITTLFTGDNGLLLQWHEFT